MSDAKIHLQLVPSETGDREPVAVYVSGVTLDAGGTVHSLQHRVTKINSVLWELDSLSDFA